MTRKRARLPEVNKSGEALKDYYRHERRIELFYEEHSSFDVRRTAIEREGYGKIHKANVLYMLLPDNTTSPGQLIKHETTVFIY